MRALYWFQSDLRLADNPGLLAAARHAKALLLVHCIVPQPGWCNTRGSGVQRQRFLHESLKALRDELAPMGQKLLVVEGHPETLIPQLVNQHAIDEIHTSEAPGFYESATLTRLSELVGDTLTEHGGNTLFSVQQLPFDLDNVPLQFTPFRRAVEKLPIDRPALAPAALPPAPAGLVVEPLPTNNVRPHIALPVQGGEHAGSRRLQQWIFEQRGIAQYKATRNCLDGLDGSSTLSPWLANGSLSARTVAHAITHYESMHGANDSSRHLTMELLWREFFQWRAHADGIKLFLAGGLRKRLRRCTFEPRNYARWCQGDTDYPLVNALMRQLVATGWMSNRGRQIAASCLINELGIDWRYGAAFFEKHLIDYHVGSNYGNWQYIAGVGTDPRGGRHFNLNKQTAEHDPDGEFTTKWGGYRPPQPEFVTDAADWPLTQDEDA
ncbi:MAG: DASH family cryptochrome [Halioglobus sp.]